MVELDVLRCTLLSDACLSLCIKERLIHSRVHRIARLARVHCIRSLCQAHRYDRLSGNRWPGHIAIKHVAKGDLLLTNVRLPTLRQSLIVRVVRHHNSAGLLDYDPWSWLLLKMSSCVNIDFIDVW